MDCVLYIAYVHSVQQNTSA